MKVERPHIAVFGAGRTGREIALAFAHGGYDVRIIDGETRKPDEFTRFADEVRAALRTALATFAVNAVDRIDARVHVVPATDIADVLARADVVVADSLVQCRLRGEIHKALAAGKIDESRVVELGNIISGRASGRTSDSQITVADLTGVAVQDIKIASAVYRALAP